MAMAQTPADAAKLRARLLERKRRLNQDRKQQQQQQQQEEEEDDYIPPPADQAAVPTPKLAKSSEEEVPSSGRPHGSAPAYGQAEQDMQCKPRRSAYEGEVVQTARSLIIEEAAKGLGESLPGRARRIGQASDAEQAQKAKATRRPVSPQAPARTPQRGGGSAPRPTSPPPMPAATKPQQKASQQPKAPSALWQQSASFKAHSLRVMRAIDGAFGMLGDLEHLVPLLQGLGRRHVGYGAKPEHYDWVGSALVSTLHAAFGPEVMNAGMTQAYVTVYRVVKHTMLLGAGEDDLGPPPTLPTAEQADAVVKTWATAKEQVGLQDVGQLFFKTLFSQHPQSMGLFSRFQHGEATPPDTSEEEDDYIPPPADQAAVPTPKLAKSSNPPTPTVAPEPELEPEPEPESEPEPEPASVLELRSELESKPQQTISDKPDPQPSHRSHRLSRTRAHTDGAALSSGCDQMIEGASSGNDDIFAFKKRRKRLVSYSKHPASGSDDDRQLGKRKSTSSEKSDAVLMTESIQQLLHKTTRVTMNTESEKAMAQEIQRLAQLEAKQKKWAWLTSLRLMPTLTIIAGFIFIILQPDLVCWALYSGSSSFWSTDMKIEEVCQGHSGLAVFLGAGQEIVPDPEPELPIRAVANPGSPNLSEAEIALLIEAVRNGNDAINLLVATSLQSGGVSNTSALALFGVSGSTAYADGSLVQQFDVNDAISNYLAVVGLIYALIFSQQYASAISRQREIEDSLATEAGGIQICMNLVRILDDRSTYNAAKVKVLLLLSSYVEDLASHIAVVAGYVPTVSFPHCTRCHLHRRRPPPPLLLPPPAAIPITC